jgi:hypothetical protein
MNRLLNPVRRSSSALRLTALRGPKTIFPIPMAQLTTDALARASAGIGSNNKKPTAWHGAGAAEFDLRSMTQSRSG